MPFITKQVAFTAAHYYSHPQWSDEENIAAFGLCANRHGHGHNYQVEVTLEGPIHPETGMIINFEELAPLLERVIVQPLDHRNLNEEVPFFKTHIPTTENIARFIGDELAQVMPQQDLRLAKVRLMEDETLFAEYHFPIGGQPHTTIHRRYTFSAAHALCEYGTKEQYGACHSLHGHNYTLWVALTGPISQDTGMIMDLRALDNLVQEQILDNVDHYSLEDLPRPVFSGPSTVENLAQELSQRLIPFLSDTVNLYKLTLAQTHGHQASWKNLR